MARCLRLLLACCACALAAAGVNAQGQDPEFKRENVTATRCLVKDAQPPAYPPGQARTQATVRVLLTFSAADLPPDITVTFDNGGPAFVAEVERHVRSYRLPCLPAGQQTVARQEFDFQIAATRSGDLRDEQDTAVSESCRAVAASWPRPDMPRARPSDGNVLVQYTFSAPDAPPAVKVLYDGDNAAQARAVVEVAREFRLPCASAANPVTATQEFRFRMSSGDGVPVLQRKLALTQLLRIIRPADRQGVRFDFTTMQCPFRLRVAPRMPYVDNAVTQLTEPSADRMEFIAWLRRVQFEIPPRLMATMFGEPTEVDVPCAVLDLT